VPNLTNDQIDEKIERLKSLIAKPRPSVSDGQEALGIGLDLLGNVLRNLSDIARQPA